MKLSKTQLDNASTITGLILSILLALAAYDYLPRQETGCIVAILTAINGYLTNKPASVRPTTEEVEDKAIQRN